MNGLTHPRVSLTLPLRGLGLGGEMVADRLAKISPATVHKQVREFLAARFDVLQYVRDAQAEGTS